MSGVFSMMNSTTSASDEECIHIAGKWLHHQSNCTTNRTETMNPQEIAYTNHDGLVSVVNDEDVTENVKKVLIVNDYTFKKCPMKIPIKTANATSIKIRFSDEQKPSTSLVSISSTQYKIHIIKEISNCHKDVNIHCICLCDDI